MVFAWQYYECINFFSNFWLMQNANWNSKFVNFISINLNRKMFQINLILLFWIIVIAYLCLIHSIKIVIDM